MIARYTFPLGGFDAYLQGACHLPGQRFVEPATSRTTTSLGDIPSVTFLDLAFGVENEKYAIELFVSNATDEDAPLDINTECTHRRLRRSAVSRVRARPRTFGIRFSQDF